MKVLIVVVVSCCFIFLCIIINKEYLETTAPIYPHLSPPFPKKEKNWSVFTTVCFSSFFNLGNCLVNSQKYIFCLKKTAENDRSPSFPSQLWHAGPRLCILSAAPHQPPILN